VEDVRGPSGATCTLQGTRVQGNVTAARGGTLRVTRTTVGADVQLFDNRGALASGNRIDGTLQCESNAPAPTGGGNVVGGNKEDQCARL
jgi:hypothetical protein